MRLANHAPDGAVVERDALFRFHVCKGFRKSAGDSCGFDDISVARAAGRVAGFFFVGDNQQVTDTKNQRLFDMGDFREALLPEDLYAAQQHHSGTIFDEGGLFGLAPAVTFTRAANNETLQEMFKIVALKDGVHGSSSRRRTKPCRRAAQRSPRNEVLSGQGAKLLR